MSELYELPDEWEWKKLGDISKLVGGGTPKRKVKEYWENGNIIWLSPTDLGKIGEISTLSNSKDKITPLGLDKSSAKLLPVGTVLYSSRATIGKIAINSVEVSTNQGFTNFICNQDLNNKYLAFCLNRFTKNIISLSNSTTFKEVSKTAFKEFRIPLPSLPEQKRIVVKLDLLFEKIDRAIALHQKNMDEADGFMGSVLNDVFGELEGKYGLGKLNSFASFQNGFAFKSKQFNTLGEGFQVIRIGNVVDILKNPVYIEERKEFKKYLLTKNDIVISMTGTRTKKDYLFVRVVNTNNTYLNQRVGRLQAKENTHYKYLYFFLQSNKFRDAIFKYETGAVNQGNISGKDIMDRFIANTPFNIQKAVVMYLDDLSKKIEKTKNIQKEKLKSLEALKASILDQAFKGAL